MATKKRKTPVFWEMDLFRWALFRYRGNLKLISTNSSLAPLLCKILGFKGHRGAEVRETLSLPSRNPAI